MTQGDHILKTLLSYWLTWLALAAVVALEIGFFVWFRPPVLMALVALALGLVCAAAWPLLFVRSTSFIRRLHRAAEEREESQQEKLQTLVNDFDDLDFSQGASQLQLLREKFENLSEIMKRRLKSGELTYARYLGMAEQVYFSALDNLHEVAVSLRSVSTIDPNHIEQRLLELRDDDEQTGEQKEEFDALRRRASLYEDQQQRVTRLIAQNETAMTVLDKTATALAETKTEKGHASMAAESAIAELEILAKRVGSYAIRE